MWCVVACAAVGSPSLHCSALVLCESRDAAGRRWTLPMKILWQNDSSFSLCFSHCIWREWMDYSLPIRNSKFTFVSLCAFPVRVHLPVLLDRFSEKRIFNHADTFRYYSILGWRYLLYNTEEQTLLKFLIAWMFFTIHKHTWKEDKAKEVKTFESHSWICYCSDLSIYHPLIFCLRNNSTDLLCKDPW